MKLFRKTITFGYSVAFGKLPRENCSPSKKRYDPNFVPFVRQQDQLLNLDPKVRNGFQKHSLQYSDTHVTFLQNKETHFCSYTLV